jgi:hypothetical protein
MCKISTLRDSYQPVFKAYGMNGHGIQIVITILGFWKAMDDPATLITAV